jgi:hypothetical protein
MWLGRKIQPEQPVRHHRELQSPLYGTVWARGLNETSNSAAFADYGAPEVLSDAIPSTRAATQALRSRVSPYQIRLTVTFILSATGRVLESSFPARPEDVPRVGNRRLPI